MKSTNYNYTLPDIDSIEENSLDFFHHNTSRPIRLLDLSGDRLRFYINKSDSNVHINSSNKNVKAEDFSAYKNLFGQLTEKFFASDTYIYCVSSNKKLYVYDIYTNENWLSTKDMEKIKSSYNYGSIGFETLKPVVDGIISTNKLVDICSAIKNPSGLYIFPSVYIDYDSSLAEEKEETKEKILFYGKEKTYSYDSGYYDSVQKRWISNNDYEDDYYGENYCHYGEKGYHYDYKTYKWVKNDPPKQEEKKARVYLLTTKKERESIFNATLKNVRLYLTKKYSRNLSQVEENCLRTITYLYSIYTLPQTREIAYDHYSMYKYDVLSADPILCWSQCFEEMFEIYHIEELKRCKNYSCINYDMIKEYLYEELGIFNDFYSKEKVPNTIADK